MTDLEETIITFLRTHGSIDIAEHEFKKSISEDADLKAEYKEWCDEAGYTERHGFREFAEEYLENIDSVWDSLSDYDEMSE